MDALPAIPQDNTDRNRTSPRPLPATSSSSGCWALPSPFGLNIALNTIMAEELKQFADQLEGSEDFQTDLQALIKIFTEHQRIIFNGNGYDDA